MPAISRTERLFAEALRREGVWFVQQARVRVGNADYLADFYLRTKRGSGVVVEIDGTNDAIHKGKFSVVRLDGEEVKIDARGAVRRIKRKFNPETASENRKKIAREKRKIRAMLRAHERAAHE